MVNCSPQGLLGPSLPTLLIASLLRAPRSNCSFSARQNQWTTQSIVGFLWGNETLAGNRCEQMERQPRAKEPFAGRDKRAEMSHDQLLTGTSRTRQPSKGQRGRMVTLPLFPKRRCWRRRGGQEQRVEHPGRRGEPVSAQGLDIDNVILRP